MKNISLSKLVIQNFKGIKDLTIEFKDNTVIDGANATGKTSTFDALCWLLFNKDSQGNTNFAVRPLDGNGNVVDNIDISVEGTFEIDGNELVLSKVQKQNWVKHRGELEKRFEGNVNTYEVDGFPKTEKEYKSIISEIIDEDIFKLLTNPQTFPGMAWKEQRQILMKFATDVSDIELASKNDLFADLITDISKAENLDDIKAKYLKAKKELNKQMTEIPARIDELSNMKVDYDAAELELQKNALLEELAKIESQYNATDTLKEKSMQLQMEVNSLYQQANDAFLAIRRRTLDSVEAKKSEMLNFQRSIELINLQIKQNQQAIDDYEKSRMDLGNEYHDLLDTLFDDSVWIMDEADNYCKMCGQQLPEDKIAEIKADFDRRHQAARDKFEIDKKNKIAKLIEQGKVVKGNADKLRETNKELEIKLSATQSKYTTLNTEYALLDKELSEMPAQVDMSKNEKYNAVKAEYESVIAKIKEAENTDTYSDALEGSKRELKEAIDKITNDLLKVQNNAIVDARIDSLEDEQRELSQKIANQDRMLYLLDEFIKVKMNVISNSINSHFKAVKFNLFKTYQNGGIEPCCEVTYKGVNYANLNAGHKVVAGLDIINSLQELYNVSCVCFVDNSEGVNDFNYPQMNCQIVKLKVSEGKTLNIMGE